MGAAPSLPSPTKKIIKKTLEGLRSTQQCHISLSLPVSRSRSVEVCFTNLFYADVRNSDNS